MIQETKSLSRIFYIHQFFDKFNFGIIFPITTLFLIDRGLDLFEVGLCIAVSSAMTFLFELPTGGLADQVGRKKVYLLSVLISSIGLLLLIFLHHKSIVFVCFGLLGIARSLSSGTIDAWFIDQFKTIEPNGNLQPVLAKAYFWTPVGIGSGCLVGGFLPQISVYFMWERYILNLVFMLITLLWIGFYTLVCIKENHIYKNKSYFSAIHSIPVVLGDAFRFSSQNPTVYLLLFAMMIWGFSVMGIENLWQPKVKSILGNDSQTWIFGLLSTGYFFSAAIGKLLTNPICRLFKNQYALTLITFRLTMGGSIIILAHQNNVYMFAFCFFIMFLQNGVLHSPHDSLFHDIVPNDKRSIFISLMSSCIYLGGMSGSFILGWVAKNHSISMAWMIGGTLMASSSILYLFFDQSVKNKVGGRTETKKIQIKSTLDL